MAAKPLQQAERVLAILPPEATDIDPNLLIAVFTSKKLKLEPRVVEHLFTEYGFSDYESLEFLGDAILHAIIRYIVFIAIGDFSPGVMTEISQILETNQLFSCLITEANLCDGKPGSSGRSVKTCADFFEALFGAVYIHLAETGQPTFEILYNWLLGYWNFGKYLLDVVEKKSNPCLRQTLRTLPSIEETEIPPLFDLNRIRVRGGEVGVPTSATEVIATISPFERQRLIAILVDEFMSSKDRDALLKRYPLTQDEILPLLSEESLQRLRWYLRLSPRDYLNTLDEKEVAAMRLAILGKDPLDYEEIVRLISPRYKGRIANDPRFRLSPNDYLETLNPREIEMIRTEANRRIISQQGQDPVTIVDNFFSKNKLGNPVYERTPTEVILKCPEEICRDADIPLATAKVGAVVALQVAKKIVATRAIAELENRGYQVEIVAPGQGKKGLEKAINAPAFVPGTPVATPHQELTREFAQRGWGPVVYRPGGGGYSVYGPSGSLGYAVNKYNLPDEIIKERAAERALATLNAQQ